MKTGSLAITLALFAAASGAAAETQTLRPGARWDFWHDVEPSGRYLLSFTARSEGPDTLENNAQLGEAFYDKRREAHGLRLPGWEVGFADADGKGLAAGICSFHRVVLSGKDTRFRDVFFAQARAARARIRFENPTKDMTLVVSDVTLTPHREPTANINADFSLGERCLSGYSTTYAGHPRIQKTADGFVMALDDYAFADPIPVVGGRTYRLEAAMANNVPKNPKIGVSYMDAQGKGIGDSGGLLWVTKAGEKFAHDYPAPPNAVRMVLFIHGAPGVRYKYVRVVEVKK